MQGVATLAGERGGAMRNTEGSGDDFIREIDRARDHIQRSHWLRPSDRDAYARARATTTNTPPPEQTSFSNARKRTRSEKAIRNNLQ